MLFAICYFPQCCTTKCSSATEEIHKHPVTATLETSIYQQLPHLTASVSIVCTARDLNCSTFTFLYSIRRHVDASRAIVKCFFSITVVWNFFFFFLCLRNFGANFQLSSVF